MGEVVPENDLPGSAVPEEDLPNTAVPETDISNVNPPGQPMETPPEPGGVPQLPVSGYGPGVYDVAKSAAMATPMGQNIKQVAQPFATAGSKVLTQYAANPITKLAPDLAAMAYGVPPPYATSQAIGATQGAYNVARKLPPTAPGPVNPMMETEFGKEIARRAAAAEAETLANRSMIQKIAMSKVMQTAGSVAGPVLNTAARVAGPAGLAYNMYEAGQMAGNTQLGERLAAGQGGAAQRAFRNMNVPYGAGFNQSISQQQAQDILASKSARDIQAFGGTEALRKKALGL